MFGRNAVFLLTYSVPTVRLGTDHTRVSQLLRLKIARVSQHVFTIYTRRSNALWRGSGVARASPGATYIVRTQAHRRQTALEAFPPTLRSATRGCRARLPAASRFSDLFPGPKSSDGGPVGKVGEKTARELSTLIIEA